MSATSTPAEYDARQRVQPGLFHRLGVAARPSDEIGEWFRRVLGARPQVGGMRQVLGLPHPTGDTDSASEESGATSQILWVGDTPVCVLVPTDEDGPLGRYVHRHGTGLHSVAWTVDDLWATEATLRRRDVRITGVDIPGRHFFMHPADSAGLLIEWTDTEFDHDPREGASLPPVEDAILTVPSVCWSTVLVPDVDRAAERLSTLMAVDRPEDGLPRPDPATTDTLDLTIGDAVIRLVSPLTDASPYPVAPGLGRLHSTGVALSGGEAELDALQEAGVRLVRREGALTWSDPSTTVGLQFEWVLAH